ncbi:MAG: hypothetical protein JSV33_10245 [bacterium]|nr:MAG: hypothetical protein JSV33_10245 [bacterium]
MRTIAFIIPSIAILVIVMAVVCPLRAKGLYLDLPGFFSVVDTARTFVTIRHADLQRGEGRASIISGELAIRPRKRVRVRLGLLYPNIQREQGIVHGVGDGFIHATARIFGDTLDASGFFLRGDARIPIGSGGLRPLSFGSLDGGLGVEFRRRTMLLSLRLVATYTLVGQRVKEGPFTHRNFLLTGYTVDFPFGDRASIQFSGFYVRFRGGGSREAYLITARYRLSDALDLCTSGMLEAGNDGNRVFNSLVAIAVMSRFP